LVKSGPLAVLLLIIGGLGLLFMKHWKTFLTLHSINIIALLWITVHGIFKDEAYPENLPYLLFFLTMDLIVLFVIIYNYFKKNTSK
jgi:hypothetical protein